MSGNNNPMAALGSGDIVGDIKNWFHTCPPFTKGLLYVSSCITILNSLTNISVILVNQPFYVVQRLQLQRLIFSPVAFLGILQALFSFLAYLGIQTRVEKEWGTVKAAVDFLWKNFFINITWIAFTYVFSIFYQAFVLVPCSGFWPPFFAFIVQTSLANPDGVSMLLCLPIQIKTKYYPIALWVLLSLFSGPRFELLAAMGVGYIHYKYLNSAYHSFLDASRMASWSSTVFFAFFKNLPNYVNASGVTVENNQSNSGSGASNARTINSTGNNNQAQAPAFRGQGVSIGGAPEEPQEAAPKQHGNYLQLNDDSEDLEASGNKTPQ